MMHRLFAAGLFAGLLAGCGHGGDVTSIPDDASLSVTACGKLIAPSDSCKILGSVRYETGDAAGANWRVDVTASIGSFSDAQMTRSVRLRTDANGEVFATFHAPADSAQVILTIIGGGLSAVDTIFVKKPLPPTPEGSGSSP